MKVGLPVSEHQIQSSIIDLLRYQGYLVWRNNVGAAPYQNKYGQKQWIRFGKPGFSDIFAIQPGTGKFIALEVKKPETRKRVTTEQQAFIDDVKEHGGIASVVCSAKEAAEVLGIKLLL